jgi:hypothetical protein
MERYDKVLRREASQLFMTFITESTTIHAVVPVDIMRLWLGMNSPERGTYYSPLTCTEFENSWSFVSLPTVSIQGHNMGIFINTHMILLSLHTHACQNTEHVSYIAYTGKVDLSNNECNFFVPFRISAS